MNLTPTEFHQQQAYRLAYAEHWLYCKIFHWYRGECLTVYPAGEIPKKPPALDSAMKSIVARARREWVEQTRLPALNPHNPETWQTAAIAAAMNGQPGVDVHSQTPKGLAKIITPWAVAKMAKIQPKVKPSVERGMIAVDGIEYPAKAHWCAAVQALIEEGGRNLTGPELSELHGCGGKKWSREFKELKESIPPLADRIKSDGPKGYRIVDF